MKAFFRSNAKYIARFFINQIVMSILGLSIGLATIALKNTVVAIIGCVFSVGMLCFLQYDFAFHLGEKHCYLPVDEEKPSKKLGYLIGIIGSVPTIVIIIIGLVFRLIFEKGTTVVLLIYYFFNGTYVQLYALINELVSQMQDLVLSGCIMWGFCLIFTLPAIISSGIGYSLGAIDKPLRTVFGIKVNDKIHRDNR